MGSRQDEDRQGRAGQGRSWGEVGAGVGGPGAAASQHGCSAWGSSPSRSACARAEQQGPGGGHNLPAPPPRGPPCAFPPCRSCHRRLSCSASFSSRHSPEPPLGRPGGCAPFQPQGVTRRWSSDSGGRPPPEGPSRHPSPLPPLQGRPPCLRWGSSLWEPPFSPGDHKRPCSRRLPCRAAQRLPQPWGGRPWLRACLGCPAGEGGLLGCPPGGRAPLPPYLAVGCTCLAGGENAAPFPVKTPVALRSAAAVRLQKEFVFLSFYLINGLMLNCAVHLGFLARPPPLPLAPAPPPALRCCDILRASVVFFVLHIDSWARSVSRFPPPRALLSPPPSPGPRKQLGPNTATLCLAMILPPPRLRSPFEGDLLAPCSGAAFRPGRTAQAVHLRARCACPCAMTVPKAQEPAETPAGGGEGQSNSPPPKRLLPSLQRQLGRRGDQGFTKAHTFLGPAHRQGGHTQVCSSATAGLDCRI